MATPKELMLSGELYIADDPELIADYGRSQELVERYNATAWAEDEQRQAILEQLFGSLGEAVTVMPPLRCDYGDQVTVGARTFINYDCVMLSSAAIEIGESCQIAPRVQLLTATHPIDPRKRRDSWEYAKPIKLGDNIWLGGGVIVCPGVTIGDNTVVGAGAVVTRDLPSDVIAIGNPARVHRPIV